jgi:hypothetical protein
LLASGLTTCVPDPQYSRRKGCRMTPQHIWIWPVILRLCISLLALAVAIAARNSGCLGTEVQQFGLQPPNGRHVQNIYDFLGQPVQLPMPLGPGGTATMTYPAEDIRRLLREQGISGGRTSGPTSTRATGDSRGSQSTWASASPNL